MLQCRARHVKTTRIRSTESVAMTAIEHVRTEVLSRTHLPSRKRLKYVCYSARLACKTIIKYNLTLDVKMGK